MYPLNQAKCKEPVRKQSFAPEDAFSATYSYLANSPSIGQVLFKSNTTVRLTTTKQYDKLNRLLSIGSAPGSGAGGGVPPLPSTTYLHNDANQRIRADKADGSAWSYEYDPLGQVTHAKRRWSDGMLVAGQQFEYTYDDIGNRKTAKEGADANGQGFRSSTYGANALNMYTNRTVPGAADVLGAAHALATVKVNGTDAYRKGEYFRKEVAVANGSAAVWQVLSNYATLGGTNQTNVGYMFVPKTPEVPAYDQDGNLTTNGQWFFTWDAENRLTKAESLSGNPTASKRKVEFTYDGGGRRVRRTEHDGSSGSYVVSRDEKWVHQGWTCLAELNATNDAVVRTYLWGLDLSGTLTGAGGVGGLLALNSTAAGVHFAAYDGNGNVESLVNAADGSVSAVYEYGPFGQTLRATGPMAFENPWRFSTKRADDALELVLYEYRAYSPTWGRWLTRDALSELGTLNTLAACLNDLIGRFDHYGLLPSRKTGYWTGDPGNSRFYFFDCERNARFPGGIPFENGTPDLSQWAYGIEEVESITPNGEQEKRDAIRQMREKRGKDWNPPPGSAWHHFDRDGKHYMQLVPDDLHRSLQHSGPRAKLRTKQLIECCKKSKARGASALLAFLGMAYQTTVADERPKEMEDLRQAILRYRRCVECGDDDILDPITDILPKIRDLFGEGAARVLYGQLDH